MDRRRRELCALSRCRRRVAKRLIFVRRPLHPPRTRHPAAVAEYQRPHHHLRVIHRQPPPVALFVFTVNCRQVQCLDHIRYEPRQMPFR